MYPFLAVAIDGSLPLHSVVSISLRLLPLLFDLVLLVPVSLFILKFILGRSELPQCFVIP